MIIDSDIIKFLKDTPNSAYESIKTEFLYHSNKLEGSTFTKENLEKYLQQNIIEGSHKLDDVYETINSTKLFDFVILTLGESLSKRLILEFHRMLKDKTLDYERGFAGCWKKIPNQISGVNLKLAQPWEVDIKIDELLSQWESSQKAFQDIIEFHVKFENIHPFQDGNGRVGRFIMLKQCLESDVDLILIDDRYSKEYKQALYLAQSKKDYQPLIEIFEQCQELLNEKLSFLKETIEYMKKHDIEMNSQ
jgi:Uncharacterized conserved protein